MEATELPLPKWLESFGRLTRYFAGNAGDNDCKRAARFQEFADIAKIQIIGAKILVGIDRNDDIEKAFLKRQIMRLGIHGCHLRA